jgi:hypothetical protein
VSDVQLDDAERDGQLRMTFGLGDIAEDEEHIPEELPGDVQIITAQQVEQMTPEKVLSTLRLATEQEEHRLTAACCHRVRALCRDKNFRKKCVGLGALGILNEAFQKMRMDASVVVQPSSTSLATNASSAARPSKVARSPSSSR